MRIRIPLSVEVDPSAWTAEYGDQGARDIRESVKSYIQTAIQQSAAGEAGAIKEVKIT